MKLITLMFPIHTVKSLKYGAYNCNQSGKQFDKIIITNKWLFGVTQRISFWDAVHFQTLAPAPLPFSTLISAALRNTESSFEIPRDLALAVR